MNYLLRGADRVLGNATAEPIPRFFKVGVRLTRSQFLGMALPSGNKEGIYLLWTFAQI